MAINTPRTLRNLAILATMLCGTHLLAQGTQTVLGGGCDSHPPATITGPLTIGSTMRIEDLGCGQGAGSTVLLFFGDALTRSQWIPLPLQTGFNRFETCTFGIRPVLALDLSRRPGIVRIEIPNLPVLRGLRFATQTGCNSCGFAGCFLGLSKIVEVTIG